MVGSPGTPERYLVNTANAAQGVAYSLYSDSGFNSVIANNTALPIASTAGGVDSYTLYGRITGRREQRNGGTRHLYRHD